MELKELLDFISKAKLKIEENHDEINKLKDKQNALLTQNDGLKKEIEKAQKAVDKQKFLQVNLSELFYEMCHTLQNYDGYLTIYPLHKTIRLSKKDLNLPSIKQLLKDKMLKIHITLSHYTKPYLERSFHLEYPLKSVVLNNGKKLINCLTVEDNAIIVPEELETSIMITPSLSEQAMTETLFKRCVLKCVEKQKNKENNPEKV